MTSAHPQPLLFNGSQESADLRQQLLDDPCTTFFSRERFFSELSAMFKYAEQKQHSWEYHLYRPWGYLLSSFCLTFFRPDMSLTCGAQYPFMNRTTGAETKTLEYCLPDFALVLSALEPENGNIPDHVFLIVEIKALPNVQWDTYEGRSKATVTLTSTVKQATRQATLAFKRHPELQRVSVLMACAVWWTVREYAREEIFPKLPETSPELPTPVDTPSPQPGQKRARGWSDRSRLRPSKNKQPMKKPKVGSPSRNPACPLAESSPTDSPSVVSSESEGSAYEPSDREGSLSDDAPGISDPVEVASKGMTVDHVMQLGSTTKLNPWLRSFFRYLIKTTPTANHEDFQNSWFDLDPRERDVYIWEHHKPSDELGFEDGFNLSNATAKLLPEFNFEDITNIVRTDEPPLIDRKGKLDLSALLSPGLKLPETVRTPTGSVRPIARSKASTLIAILNNAQSAGEDRPETPLGEVSDGGRSELHDDTPSRRAGAQLSDVDEDSGEAPPGLGEESPSARATARARVNRRTFSHAAPSIVSNFPPASNTGFAAFMPNLTHGTAVAHNPRPGTPHDSQLRFTKGSSRPILAPSSRGTESASSLKPLPTRLGHSRSTTVHSSRSLGVGEPSRTSRGFSRHPSNPFLDNHNTGQQGSGLFADVARGRSSERSRSRSVTRASGARSQTVDSPGRHREASVDGDQGSNNASGDRAPTHRRRSSSFSGLGSAGSKVAVIEPHRTSSYLDSEVTLNLETQGAFGITGDLHLPSFVSSGPSEAGPSNLNPDQSNNDKHASSKDSTNEGSKPNERDWKGKGKAS